jgi:hypothetical protein
VIGLLSSFATAAEIFRRVAFPFPSSAWTVQPYEKAPAGISLLPVKAMNPPPCGYVGTSLSTILNESRIMPLGTSETINAGELVVHGRYPFHENLTDIANALGGKIRRVVAKPSGRDYSSISPFHNA